MMTAVVVFSFHALFATPPSLLPFFCLSVCLSGRDHANACAHARILKEYVIVNHAGAKHAALGLGLEQPFRGGPGMLMREPPIFLAGRPQMSAAMTAAKTATSPRAREVELLAFERQTLSTSLYFLAHWRHSRLSAVQFVHAVMDLYVLPSGQHMSPVH